MKVIPNIVLDEIGAVVTEWGIVDDLVLYPDDRLTLRPPREGDLLLLKPYGIGKLKLGRLYNEELILEPHKTSISKERWVIVGGIQGIERPLDVAGFGTGNWYLKAYNLPSDADWTWLHMLEQRPITSIYITELARQLYQYFPEVSLCIARSIEQLKQGSSPSKGCISISCNRTDEKSMYSEKWALASNRAKRRRKSRIQKNRTEVNLFPIPSLSGLEECVKLASK